MPISFKSLSGGASYRQKIDRITSTQTWTCPADVTQIEVILAAGGGGGENYSAASIYHFGGRGNLRHEILTVTPNTNYTVTIGAGGAVGASGGSSSFGALLTVNGGGAGGFTNDGIMLSGDGMASSVHWWKRDAIFGMSNSQDSTPFGLSPMGYSEQTPNSFTFPGTNNFAATGSTVNAIANYGGGGGSSRSQRSAGGSGVCIIKYWSAL